MEPDDIILREEKREDGYNMEKLTAAKICEEIMAAEREAGECILHAHGILAENKTDHRNVVTEYDRKIQAMLMDRLSRAVPGARFFCEEDRQQDALDSEYVFIIDPIDGTMNFVRGFHHSCVSVGCLHRGELCAGAVFNPYMKEMFHAVRGAGAFLNGRPIRVDPAPLSESVVCVGTSPYSSTLTDLTFRTMEKVYRASLDIRREGSAALDLCSVAAGRAGLYFEEELSLWDYAAGVLLVREAGGHCCCVDGSELPLDGKKHSVLAGGKQAVTDFLALDK